MLNKRKPEMTEAKSAETAAQQIANKLNPTGSDSLPTLTPRASDTQITEILNLLQVLSGYLS